MRVFPRLATASAAAAAALLAALAALLLLLLAEAPERERQRQDRRAAVTLEAESQRVRLEAVALSVFHTAQALELWIAAQGSISEADFTTLAATIYSRNPTISHIAFSEGLVIRHVYPANGNRPILGLDYRNLPSQFPAIERAIESRRPVIAGPQALIQGGTGLIQRIPVFSADTNGAEGTLLGIVSVVVMTDYLFSQMEQDPGIRYALRGSDGLGADGGMVYGEATLFDDAPVILPIPLPGGGLWQLAATPVAGWEVGILPQTTPRRLIWGLVLALSALGGAGFAAFQQSRGESRRRIAEGEARLREAQRIAGLGHWTLSLPDRRFQMSEEALHLLGLPPNQPLTRFSDYLARIPEEDRSWIAERFDGMFTGSETLVVEHRVVRADGAVRWLQCRGQRTAGTSLFTATLLDVTERRQIEESRLTVLQTLQRSNEELERYAYIASHDLQEPLRLIVSYLQLLQRRYGGHLDAEADTFIAFAVDGARRMQRQVNDLLAFSRIDQQREEASGCDATQALEEALKNLANLSTETGATLVVEPSLPQVACGQSSLTSVFQHLVGNALKYRRLGVPPVVRISAQQGGGLWHFTISDNGQGIDPAYHEQIFQIFQRLVTPDHSEGSGIGLALCRRIIERCGGHIWLESQVGLGSSFHFTLPPAPS